MSTDGTRRAREAARALQRKVQDDARRAKVAALRADEEARLRAAAGATSHRVITYSDGGSQEVLTGVDRPDLGTVNRYSDGGVETIITHAPGEDTDSRDPLCDDCAHAPGEHPVASLVAYCDTKHEHEVRVITDKVTAYAYGTGPSGQDAEEVSLAVSLLATATPTGGMILESACPQHVYGDSECPGYVRWTLSADDFSAALPPAFRSLLAQYGKAVEDL